MPSRSGGRSPRAATTSPPPARTAVCSSSAASSRGSTASRVLTRIEGVDGHRRQARRDPGGRREVMVVVLGHEEAEIDHRHRLLQAWMKRHARQRRRVHRLEPKQDGGPGAPEGVEQIRKRPLVVARLMSLAVVEVGGAEDRRAAIEVLEALFPQRLEVEQVAGMLLNRPAAAGPVHEHGRGQIPEPLFEASDGLTKADHQLGCSDRPAGRAGTNERTTVP